MGDENDKLLSLVKNITGSDDVNAEGITEWMANDEVNELIENDIVELLTDRPISERKKLRGLQ